MADAYIGEIRWLSLLGGKPPTGWRICDGSLMPITGNEALYAVIGVTYGGDARSTFALPNLLGRVPIHQGTGTGLTARTIGANGGYEAVPLAASQLGGHGHDILASSSAATSATPTPTLTVAAVASSDTFYTSGAGASATATLLSASISSEGLGTPHLNCAPTMPINACICISGVFPVKP
jgi:microcystin-dependent protein